MHPRDGVHLPEVKERLRGQGVGEIEILTLAECAEGEEQESSQKGMK